MKTESTATWLWHTLFYATMMGLAALAALWTDEEKPRPGLCVKSFLVVFGTSIIVLVVQRLLKNYDQSR